MEETKVYLEQKIDAAMALENKFLQNKEDLKQVQDVMLRTKTELAQQVTDMRMELSKQTIVHENSEVRMDQTITDSKFWLEKYSKMFKDNDRKIGAMEGIF